jgi:hypothetical protein
MTTLPTIKPDLIAGLDDRRAKAKVFVDTVSFDLKVHDDSDWTAKDLITHLTAFEADMVEAIQAFMVGKKYRLDFRGQTSIDGFNEVRRQEQAGIPWEQALQEWQTVRDQLRDVIIAFPENDLNTPFTTPFMQKYDLLQAVKGCGGHEKMHVNEIKSASNPDTNA